jgi:hypothetical protein
MAQLLHRNGNNFAAFATTEIGFSEEGKMKLIV